MFEFPFNPIMGKKVAKKKYFFNLWAYRYKIREKYETKTMRSERKRGSAHRLPNAHFSPPKNTIKQCLECTLQYLNPIFLPWFSKSKQFYIYNAMPLNSFSSLVFSSYWIFASSLSISPRLFAKNSRNFFVPPFFFLLWLFTIFISQGKIDLYYSSSNPFSPSPFPSFFLVLMRIFEEL